MENVSQSLTRSVTDNLKGKLSLFANEVSRITEGKVKPQQVIDLWNETTDVKIVDVPLPKPVAAQPQESKKSKKKVEDGTGCVFILTRGNNKGNPCNDKCVQGSTFCSRHNKMLNGEPTRKTTSSKKKKGDDDE